MQAHQRHQVQIFIGRRYSDALWSEISILHSSFSATESVTRCEERLRYSQVIRRLSSTTNLLLHQPSTVILPRLSFLSTAWTASWFICAAQQSNHQDMPSEWINQSLLNGQIYGLRNMNYSFRVDLTTKCGEGTLSSYVAIQFHAKFCLGYAPAMIVWDTLLQKAHSFWSRVWRTNHSIIKMTAWLRKYCLLSNPSAKKVFWLMPCPTAFKLAWDPLVKRYLCDTKLISDSNLWGEAGQTLGVQELNSANAVGARLSSNKERILNHSATFALVLQELEQSVCIMLWPAQDLRSQRVEPRRMPLRRLVLAGEGKWLFKHQSGTFFLS